MPRSTQFHFLTPCLRLPSLIRPSGFSQLFVQLLQLNNCLPLAEQQRQERVSASMHQSPTTSLCELCTRHLLLSCQGCGIRRGLKFASPLLPLFTTKMLLGCDSHTMLFELPCFVNLTMGHKGIKYVLGFLHPSPIFKNLYKCVLATTGNPCIHESILVPNWVFR